VHVPMTRTRHEALAGTVLSACFLAHPPSCTSLSEVSWCTIHLCPALSEHMHAHPSQPQLMIRSTHTYPINQHTRIRDRHPVTDRKPSTEKVIPDRPACDARAKYPVGEPAVQQRYRMDRCLGSAGVAFLCTPVHGLACIFFPELADDAL